MAAKEGNDDGRREPRTTLSLSLTVADKKELKLMALEADTTVAGLIHAWIGEHRKAAE